MWPSVHQPVRTHTHPYEWWQIKRKRERERRKFEDKKCVTNDSSVCCKMTTSSSGFSFPLLLFGSWCNVKSDENVGPTSLVAYSRPIFDSDIRCNICLSIRSLTTEIRVIFCVLACAPKPIFFEKCQNAMQSNSKCYNNNKQMKKKNRPKWITSGCGNWSS